MSDQEWPTGHGGCCWSYAVDGRHAPNCALYDPGTATTDYRGQWPGGWKEDPETGHLAFAIRDGAEEPVWACVLCQKGQLHTLPEHEKILNLAAKR